MLRGAKQKKNRISNNSNNTYSRMYTRYMVLIVVGKKKVTHVSIKMNFHFFFPIFTNGKNHLEGV
jgi:hypothetical protein